MTNDSTLIWQWTNEYLLTLTAATNGTANTNVSGWYTNGLTVEISATGDTGYAFSQWTGDVPLGGHTNNPLTVTMDQARTIQANFASNSPQTKIWTGTANWASATNWSPAGMPGPQDTAIIQSGKATLCDPTWIAVMTNSGTLTFSGWHAVVTASNVVIAAAGRVNHLGPTTNSAVSNRVRFVSTTMTINGTINVTSNGYYGGMSGVGHLTGYGPGGGGTHNGGGHGGVGGHGGGATYGSSNMPVTMGSGGGNGGYEGSSANGGHGGGVVYLAVGTLIVNGSIIADGSSGAFQQYCCSGGGAGGSIWIVADTLQGAGNIYARGGAAATDWSDKGGGGGGGRIAIYLFKSPYYTTGRFTGTIAASGGVSDGTSTYDGYPGTIYLKQWPRGTVLSTW
jgi:hypothetical protein